MENSVGKICAEHDREARTKLKDKNETQQQQQPSNVTAKDPKVYNGEEIELAYAMAGFKPFGVNQLSFKEGQEVRILLKQDCNWWWAELDGWQGYVPANHFTRRTSKQFVWQDDEYFGNYSHLKLHQEMLSDRPRTEAYLQAVQMNEPFLRDKVILDVGCGTGVLSMFCAKYGNCKKVYAVEASDFAHYTAELVKINGLDEKIAVINDYVEQIQIEDKVDVIISEWMGTFLLFEMMLESVIIARDKFLRSDGVVLPSMATLYLVPCSADSHYKETYQFWDKLYGLDFSLLRRLAVEEYYERPISDYILGSNDCLADAVAILNISMATVTVGDLEMMEERFEFKILKSGTMHGFCSWFEVEFPPLAHGVARLNLSTGPYSRLTHWRQNLFMLDKPVTVAAGDIISGHVRIQRNPQLRRHIRLHLSFSVLSQGVLTNETKEVEKTYKIWR
ncbi:protein arginine N-methyltransferase 2-like isoform X2 [Liolophura sinensis]|uniref:protein arginine N-methyltransferase 2-like isoform X2 n=1 Tax=Liolophura sinensis TaxID=3198878 RepID=UPI003158F306